MKEEKEQKEKELMKIFHANKEKELEKLATEKDWEEVDKDTTK